MILQRINKDKVKEEEREFGVFYEVTNSNLLDKLGMLDGFIFC